MLDSVYVYAARYAHHRNTGAAIQVIAATMAANVSDETLMQMIRESYEATYNKGDWVAFRKAARDQMKDRAISWRPSPYPPNGVDL